MDLKRIRRKLFVALFLVVGTLFLFDAFTENIGINYPIGLALSCYGLFWLCGV